MKSKTKKMYLATSIMIMTLSCITACGDIRCHTDFSKKEEKEIVMADLVYDTRTYYYDQLNAEEKSIYDILESSKSEIMDNQEVFLGNIQASSGEAKEKGRKLLDKVMRAYRMDIPLSTMWLSNCQRLLDIGDPEDDTFGLIIRPKEGRKYYDFENKEELEEALKKVQIKTEEFVSNLKGSDETKLRKIHDWILQNAKYDDTLTKKNNNNVYGSIIQKEGVCTAYTYAFKYVADMAELPVICVMGLLENVDSQNEEVNHIWNKAYMKDKWYMIDLSGDINEKEGRKPLDRFFQFSNESDYLPVKEFAIP